MIRVIKKGRPRSVVTGCEVEYDKNGYKRLEMEDTRKRLMKEAKAHKGL